MAKVLVTGGAGFIGSHLVDRLLDQGHRVVVLDDFSSGSRKYLPAAHDGLEVIADSIRNVERYADRFRDVERVFHLAALISGYESLETPDAYFDTNVTGLLHVLRACRNMARPRVIFASSSGVYGNSDAPVRMETDLPRPATVYALTKLNGEHLLDMYRGHYAYDDVSLRFFNVYGPRQSKDHPYANVTCKFSWAGATGAPVVLYGDGEQTRDFVHVTDAVRALLKVSEGPTPRRVYNVGTGDDASIASLLEMVQSIAGRRLVIDRRPPWPNDIRRIRADVSALRDDLGLVTTIPIREGLATTIEYFRSAGT
jgi:UDP-glucose 4-epimerase